MHSVESVPYKISQDFFNFVNFIVDGIQESPIIADLETLLKSIIFC